MLDHGHYEGLPVMALMPMVSIRACLDMVLNHRADVCGEYQGLPQHGARPRGLIYQFLSQAVTIIPLLKRFDFDDEIAFAGDFTIIELRLRRIYH